MARALEQPRAFVDMLFTSARMRGLIKPSYGRGNKVAWVVSPHGLTLISRHAEVDDWRATDAEVNAASNLEEKPRTVQR
jgi:hypothetical protein